MKKGVYFLFFALALLLMISEASASFACGRVNNSKDFSAVGFNVKVYYQENPSLSTSCKVGAAENKYCCDLEDIKGIIWQAGKKVVAETIPEEGYSADSVGLVISGEGFDIFPEMSLKKVIEIYPELKKIYVNTTSFFVNISTFSGYDKINYSVYSKGEKIREGGCVDCTNLAFYLDNLSYGGYALNVTANNGRIASKLFNFTLLKYLNFNREIKCNRCGNQFVPFGREVNVTISLNASDRVSGTIFEYFPNNWALGGNESFEEYSASHNSLSWEFDGKEARRSYIIHSPQSFLPQKYTFQSEFEGVKSEEMLIISFWFNFPFFSINHLIKDSSQHRLFQMASPSVPLVIKFDSGFLRLVSIFPNDEIKNAFASVSIDKKAGTFEIRSNVPNKKIDRILVRFTLDKNMTSGRNVSLKEYAGDDNFEAVAYSENESSVLYESYLDKKGKFKIVF